VLEAERVRAFGALRSLRCRKKLAAVERQETHILSKEENERWIEDHVETETVVARKRVEDAETAIKQKQKDMSNVEKAGLTTRNAERTFEEMLNAIGDSLSDVASSEHEEDPKDQEADEDTEQGKLSEDHEPGWVVGTISKTVQRRMAKCCQKQMKLAELAQPGWRDAADCYHERDKMYGMTELTVPAVVKSQTDQVAAALPLTTFEELIETLDIVPGISQMPQDISQPGHSHIRLGLRKPQSPEYISSLPPAAESDSLHIKYVTQAEPVLFSHCILPPELITI